MLYESCYRRYTVRELFTIDNNKKVVTKILMNFEGKLSGLRKVHPEVFLILNFWSGRPRVDLST